jgi:hypothetical protein
MPSNIFINYRFVQQNQLKFILITFLLFCIKLMLIIIHDRNRECLLSNLMNMR